ncbi:N-acetylglutaminylglutamine amidotransferase [Aneurinibacillus sp. UBA3580]|jgi:asparagine synthase (glutamine-hydrolysing)|uniref:N-acetylglutaminylglutamine amidotransferase n=1 Tax=Aneurinibacillus sp. UBA3580 TaxID=1946041 RepID=UPI00257B8F75|nr:N-acetylglutaminylglutamine amidotransferase [Aneurinibacillus sp. UBA3580]
MCGICGVIRYDKGNVDEGTVQNMLPALETRGPDASGVYMGEGFGFGHRRLSIIDLSENGHQPMIDEELKLEIVYNGEIYNFKQLRDELQQQGYSFRSTSDTEVLLKAYHAWGDEFVKRLNGMFSFCIHDQIRGRFLLGRDRLGIKPLYYAEEGHAFYFASNTQALNRAGMIRPELSPEALHYYLSFHAVVPAPYTIFKNVKKLAPGTIMSISADGAKEISSYWDVKFERSETLSEEEWIERVLDELRQSVKRRMVSDVPVGALLSGGLDSSLIVALMAECNPQSLHTYSIGFEDVGTEEGNEFYYSDIIAKEFGTEHKKIFINSRRLLPNIEKAISAMAEPMVSHDAVAFYLLSEEVSKETKVVLSGQGADEVFAGYHWYPKVMNGTRDAVTEYREAFFDRTHEEVIEALQTSYHGPDVSGQFVANHFTAPGAAEPVDKALRLDTRVMLIDDPVKRVDNMTMAWGLEARVPFLDYKLVELAASIPPDLKVASGGKHILKKAGERVIPHEVIYRKKGYFPVPALKYLRDEYLDFAREILSTEKAKQRGLFNPAYVEKLLQAPEDHMTVLGGSKLWQLTVLELWLQKMGC